MMKKYEMATERNYSGNIICLVLSDNEDREEYILGVQNSFYDKDDNVHSGIEFLSRLEKEPSNSHITMWYGTLEKDEFTSVEVINNGLWYVFTDPRA
jgi:hypothetical protein